MIAELLAIGFPLPLIVAEVAKRLPTTAPAIGAPAAAPALITRPVIGAGTGATR